EVVLPDGRRIDDGRPGGDELALRSEADLGVRYELDSKKLLGVNEGRHHILALSKKLPAGKYQVWLDVQERDSPAQVTVALIPDTEVKEVRRHSGRDAIFQQHIQLAAEARDWKDTTEELKQLLPAFEYAIQSRSLESVEGVAQSLNRAYCDIDQPEKGLVA